MTPTIRLRLSEGIVLDDRQNGKVIADCPTHDATLAAYKLLSGAAAAPLLLSRKHRNLFSAELGEIPEFTCDNCGAVANCDYAFDPYNTNGDCLAEK